MKAVLGFQDEVIGFGLVGIDYMVEIKKSVKPEAVWQIAVQLAEVADIIFISEHFYWKINSFGIKLDAKLVMIPADKESVGFEDVEKLIKTTIGINI